MFCYFVFDRMRLDKKKGKEDFEDSGVESFMLLGFFFDDNICVNYLVVYVWQMIVLKVFKGF